MSEEIKYEAVFGDQSLFDGMMDDCELACGEYGYKVKGSDLFYCEKYNQRYGWSKSIKSAFQLSPVLAMRRIIRTPTWTIADQKAWKLPEAGCLVMVSQNCTATVTAVDNVQKVVAVQCENQALDILSIYEILPIESPEEKAARLEDEWVNKAWGETAVFAGVTQDEHDRLRIHLRHIYRAQLSGELAAPKGGE